MPRTAKPEAKSTPPYLPAKTLLNLLAGWQVALPARIDRTLFKSFSGAMQSWVISTLRYFELIDQDGHPTELLKKLVNAAPYERGMLFADIVKRGYAFVFSDNLDLSKATSGQLYERFKDTGLQGDTIRKATALFLAMAREGGLTISPFVRMSRAKRTNGVQRKFAQKPAKPKTPLPVTGVNQPPGTLSTKPIFQVLYELLDSSMSKEEEAAIWTLLRYLKKREVGK